jgi:hypothetical protein
MQTDREAYNEFARGLAFCLTVVVGLVLFVVIFGTADETKPKTEERFKVVDTYGPCEVVRYAPKGEAKFAYFLDCK